MLGTHRLLENQSSIKPPFLAMIEPGASIEDDLEGLRGSSNGDGTIVLSVHVVGERLRLEAGSLVSPSSRVTLE